MQATTIAKEPRKQAISGRFWAGRTYWGRIKDDHKIEHAYTGGGFIAPMALSALPPEKQPSACLQCRSCEQVCPQQIKISEVLAVFSEKLG